MGRHTTARDPGEGHPSPAPDDPADTGRLVGGLTFRWPDSPAVGTALPGDGDAPARPGHLTADDRPGRDASARPSRDAPAWPDRDVSSWPDRDDQRLDHTAPFAALSPESLAAEAATGAFSGSAWSGLAEEPWKARTEELGPEGGRVLPAWKGSDEPSRSALAGGAPAPKGGQSVVGASGTPAGTGRHGSLPGDERDGKGRRGFLGSGWNDEPRPPRRLRRMALISGFSVVLAVGLTVGGVKLAAGRTALTMEPPSSECATAAQCDSAPGGTLAAGGVTAPAAPGTFGAPDSAAPLPGDTGDLGSDAGPTSSASPSALPSAGDAPAGAGTPTTPGSRTTKASGGKHTREPSATGSPAGVPDDTSASSDDSPVSGGDSPADTGSSAAAGGTTGDDADTPMAADADDPQARADAPGDVSVDFAVTGRDRRGYAAQLAVRNEGAALSSWTIELPVGGRVTGVEGADWRQDGGTLVVTSGDPLTEGGELRIAFDAVGDPRTPGECVLAGGDCAVAATSSHERRRSGH
ncbi:hypothetical protein [Microbispora sp. NPDC049125]|uniref:hypothetical protein n=1 Tax=Microbispora sp. NPDC049125 TaxID=3154929 RepID=UPI003466D9BB